MQEFRVIIPDEHYHVIEFIQDEMPGIAVINSNLKQFNPKEVFSWHCSIMVHFENLIENGMPSLEDTALREEFENWLDDEIKGKNKRKPNALFLGRITWNGTRELIWRVYNPKITNELLQDIINENDDDLLPFDYRIDHDESWELAKWHLDNCPTSMK